MALVVATFKGQIGSTALVDGSYGQWITYEGGTGVNAADVLLDLVLPKGAQEVVLLTRAGAVDVTGSIDGTNFGTTVLALEDLTSAAPTTRVVVTTANKAARLPTMGFKRLKFAQNGATAASLEVAIRIG